VLDASVGGPGGLRRRGGHDVLDRSEPLDHLRRARVDQLQPTRLLGAGADRDQQPLWGVGLEAESLGRRVPGEHAARPGHLQQGSGALPFVPGPQREEPIPAVTDHDLVRLRQHDHAVGADQVDLREVLRRAQERNLHDDQQPGGHGCHARHRLPLLQRQPVEREGRAGAAARDGRLGPPTATTRPSGTAAAGPSSRGCTWSSASDCGGGDVAVGAGRGAWADGRSPIRRGARATPRASSHDHAQDQDQAQPGRRGGRSVAPTPVPHPPWQSPDHRGGPHKLRGRPSSGQRAAILTSDGDRVAMRA
jgi:hypothetical protein